MILDISPGFIIFVIAGVLGYSFFVGRVLACALRMAWIPGLISTLLGLVSVGLIVYWVSVVIGFSSLSVKIVVLSVIFICCISAYRNKIQLLLELENKRKIIIFIALGLFVGFISCSAIFPHAVDADRYLVAMPMFDNAKVAIVDSILREGLPVINPFGISASGSEYLHYYFFWYFICAVIAEVFNCSGYLATISLLAITSALSFWCIVMISEKIIGREHWIVSYCFALLALFLPNLPNPAFFSRLHALEPMLYQMPWVPQHVFSAICVICFFYIVIYNKFEQTKVAQIGCIISLSIIAVVGLGCSAYVGGICFILCSLILFLYQIFKHKNRSNVLYIWCSTAVLSIVLCAPIVVTFFGATGNVDRAPIAFKLWKSIKSNGFVTNLLAYFTIACSVYFGAIYFGFLGALKKGLFKINKEWLLVAVVSLCIPCFIASVIANNDLGWRCILPFLFIASACMPVLFDKNLCSRIVICVFIILQLVYAWGFVYNNIRGNEKLVVYKEDIQAVMQIREHTDQNARLLLNTIDTKKFHGRNLIMPLILNRKMAFFNGSYGHSLGEKTPFNNPDAVIQEMNHIFDQGIVPSRDFLATMHVDYLAFMKKDKGFEVDIQSDYLQLSYQTDLVKIYKFVN